MNFLQGHSIMKKFWFMFGAAVAAAVACAVIFYQISVNSLKKEKQRYIDGAATNLMQSIDDICSSIQMIAEAVSSASYTQNYLTRTYYDSNNAANRQAISRLIGRISSSSAHVDNILLIDSEGEVLSFNSSGIYVANRLNQEYGIFSTVVHGRGFSGGLYLEDNDSTYYTYYQTIYEGWEQDREIGTCLVVCSGRSLERVCSSAAAVQGSFFALLDEDGQVISCSSGDYTKDRKLPEINGKDHLICRYTNLILTNWQVYCAVPYSEMYADMNYIQAFASFFIIVLILVFLVLGWQLNRNFLHPLKEINSFLQNEPYYVLHNRLEVKNQNEISFLCAYLNQLLDRILHLNHTVLQNQANLYEMELARNEAQLLALQTQINPHFLYNTLNSIQGLAYQGKRDEICKVVGSLAFLLRYNVKGDNMALVKDEFACIEKFLQIIRIRYPDRYQFRLVMENGTGECGMPRFLLQPLVENAISHGLEPSPGNGELTLAIFLQEENLLHIECSDNGVGIQPDKLAALRQRMEKATPDMLQRGSSGIGLLNIHLRIKLLYGERYGLSLRSGSEGTVVCADFPAFRENK